MALGIEVLASNIESLLSTLAPIISLILILLGGIVYGVAQTQPAEVRGKWQVAGMGLFVGGLIIGAIAGAAVFIQTQSSGLLKPA
jgi:hypothetical protein